MSWTPEPLGTDSPKPSSHKTEGLLEVKDTPKPFLVSCLTSKQLRFRNANTWYVKHLSAKTCHPESSGVSPTMSIETYQVGFLLEKLYCRNNKGTLV